MIVDSNLTCSTHGVVASPAYLNVRKMWKCDVLLKFRTAVWNDADIGRDLACKLQASRQRDVYLARNKNLRHVSS